MTLGNSKLAVLFPGQGSQYLGMVQDFIETDSEAEALMDKADEISALPIRKLCLEGPMEELTRAANLQPALTAADLICWTALKKKGIRPDFVAGHSLGEFSALCAAGVLSFEDTMTLVTARGRLMEREGEKHPGGMRAVLGLTLPDVEAGISALKGGGIVTAANHNSEKQVVISGEIHGLDEVTEIFNEKGARVIPLNVSIANHSPLVQDAIPDFIEVMQSIEFKSPEIPLLFNVTAREESDPATIRDIMARQIASRVRWFDIMNTFISNDVRFFIEAGPKTVLSGLLKKIVPRGYEYQRFQVDNPENLQSCLQGMGRE